MYITVDLLCLKSAMTTKTLANCTPLDSQSVLLMDYVTIPDKNSTPGLIRITDNMIQIFPWSSFAIQKILISLS